MPKINIHLPSGYVRIGVTWSYIPLLEKPNIPIVDEYENPHRGRVVEISCDEKDIWVEFDS